MIGNRLKSYKPTGTVFDKLVIVPLDKLEALIIQLRIQTKRNEIPIVLSKLYFFINTSNVIISKYCMF